MQTVELEHYIQFSIEMLHLSQVLLLVFIELGKVLESLEQFAKHSEFNKKRNSLEELHC